MADEGTPAATTTTAAAAAAATTTTTTTAPREHVEATVLDKAKRSNEACQAGEFRAAIDMYTEAIALDLNNHVLISNRSAAFVHIKKYQEALSDADKVVELKPDWAKGYYRRGIALHHLKRHTEAIVAFSKGLGLDSGNVQMLSSLIDTTTLSPIQDTFCPVLEHFQEVNLNSNAFVMTSVIGQQLLGKSYYHEALTVLLSARQIGSDNLKLKASLFSALGTAYWKLRHIEAALDVMTTELAMVQSIDDARAECRVLNSMGKCHQEMGNYKAALHHHKRQAKLAGTFRDTELMAMAISNLGVTYYELKEYTRSLQCHEKCLEYAKDLDDATLMAQELGHTGRCHMVMGNMRDALACFEQQAKIAKQLDDDDELAKAYSHLGAAHQTQRNYEAALRYHQDLLDVARTLENPALEARAFAGMGHANGSLGHLKQALACHKQQLIISTSMKDSIGEAHSFSNLGGVYQQLGKYDDALKNYTRYLMKARELRDRVGEGRAYGHLGGTHSALGNHMEAIKFHNCMLKIAREVGDQRGEASTCGNLGIAWQALREYKKAHDYFRLHLDMAQKLRDPVMECQALNNIGNYCCLMGKCGDAISYLRECLQLARDLHDVGSQLKACGNLGKAYDAIGNIVEARNFYEQAFTLAKQMESRGGISKASLNLDQIYKTLGDFQNAVHHHEEVLAVSTRLKHVVGRCNALANLGDIYLNATDYGKAVDYYDDLLTTAKRETQRSFEAMAHRGLGNVANELGEHAKALDYFQNDAKIRRELNEPVGLATAYMNMGSAHNSLGHFEQAIHCYGEKLKIAKQLNDRLGEAMTFGVLGIVKRNTANFDQALEYHQKQLEIMKGLASDKGDDQEVAGELATAYANLGDSYELMRQYADACACHEEVLNLSRRVLNVFLEMRAYAGLGRSNLRQGKTHLASLLFERRLQLAIQQHDVLAEAECYADLGDIQRSLGYYDQAMDYHRKQLEIAVNLQDKRGESDAIYGLAEVSICMGDYRTAVEYQMRDLDLSRELNQENRQLRAYSRLGFSYRMMGDLVKAIESHQETKALATKLDKPELLCVACCDLGVDYRLFGAHDKALAQLDEGLKCAARLPGRSLEHEAKLRHNMGLVLLDADELTKACTHLYRATSILDQVRRELHFGGAEDRELRKLQALGYAKLQQALVRQGETEEALCVAERAKAGAFANCLLDRDINPHVVQTAGLLQELSTFSLQEMKATAKNAQAPIIYYSIAQDYLYTWVLAPDDGVVVAFHETCLPSSMAGIGVESDVSDGPESGLSLPDQIAIARMALGLDDELSVKASSAVAGGAATLSRSPSLESSMSTGYRPPMSPTSNIDSADDDRRWASIDQLDSLTTMSGEPSKSGSPASSSGQRRDPPSRRRRYPPTPRRNRIPSGEALDEAAAVIAGSRATSPVERQPPSLSHRPRSNLSTSSSRLPPPTPVRRSSLRSYHSRGSGRDSPDYRGGGGGGNVAGSFLSGSVSSLNSSANTTAFQGLYDLLIAPIEDCLPEGPSATVMASKPLIIVPDGELYLVPFGLLRSPKEPNPICYHYRLIIAPSLHCMHLNQTNVAAVAALGRAQSPSLPTEKPVGSDRYLIIGNPSAPTRTEESRWWGSLPGGEREAKAIADLFHVRPLLRQEPTMDRVLKAMTCAELVHFSTYISWKLSVLVLAGPRENRQVGDQLSDFLLTLDRILELRMRAKIVVIGSSQRGSRGAITSDGLLSLSRAFLAAGAQCVVVSLWPVSDKVSQLFMNAFYASLLRGSHASRALDYAVRTVRLKKGLSNPKYWSGFVLIGNDVVLGDQAERMAAALRVMLQHPLENRSAFKAVKFLINRALDRISEGKVSAQFASYEDVRKKVGSRTRGGWDDLLVNCGYHIKWWADPNARNGVQSQKEKVVFFPEHDDSGILRECFDTLDALIGLPGPVLQGLTMLLRVPHVSSSLRNLLQTVLDINEPDTEGIIVGLDLALWETFGCREFLESLSFAQRELVDDEVQLFIPFTTDKLALERTVQVLRTVFGPLESIVSPYGTSTSVAELQNGSLTTEC
ncbi:tetratricopeptide repeat protein 28-like isoform X1 [Oscarella lobularis]|uniref:tetratricopeptide repeat protein 28-like isoform X1 n=1 Tax=Oscarella lobularis TaxID=121494 RepID=UPI0033143B14